MAIKTPPRLEDFAKARLLYDQGVQLRDIQARLGMTKAQFYLFRINNGWPLRPSAVARNAITETALPEEAIPPTPGGFDPAMLIARIEDAVEREFARTEKSLKSAPPKAIESSARTLASLVRTLAELKRMRRDVEERQEIEDGATNDNDAAPIDDSPRELAELRAELARRLERLRGERPAE